MTPPLEPWTGSLVEALLAARDMSLPSSQREAGARAVHAQLLTYARRFQKLEAGELVAQAWMRALTKEISALGRPADDPRREPELKSWLKTVVANIATDAFRRQKRERDRMHRAKGDDPSGGDDGDRLDELPSPAAPDEDDEEHAALAERALQAVGGAFERARASCGNDEVRSDFDAAWGEITALVEGTATVDALLAPHVGTPEFVRRRDALYKRHERARKRVLAACDELEGEAGLPAEDLTHARAAVEGYFKRRQIRPRDASKGAKA